MGKPIFIAGPCVIESQDVLETVALELVRLREKYGLTLYFKASFDKANRTSVNGIRGMGLNAGIQAFADIKSKLNIPCITNSARERRLRTAAITCKVRSF